MFMIEALVQQSKISKVKLLKNIRIRTSPIIFQKSIKMLELNSSNGLKIVFPVAT
jgi:hypothetical protein